MICSRIRPVVATPCLTRGEAIHENAGRPTAAGLLRGHSPSKDGRVSTPYGPPQ
jgi:hypothetical protein